MKTRTPQRPEGRGQAAIPHSRPALIPRDLARLIAAFEGPWHVTLCSSLAVQLDHVVIDVVRWLDEAQEFCKKRGAKCGRGGQKKLAKSGNRDIARIITHYLWGAAAIDDRGIKNAPI